MIRTLAATLATGTCIVALATPAAAQAREYNISAGSLKDALDAYVRQSGRQIVYRSDEVRAARSPGAKGAFAPEDALAALLEGSGFSTRVDGNLVAIVKVGNGHAEDAASSGNVEIVVTAEALSAMRVPTPLKDIPQSVSVISRKTMDEQNANDLSDALHYATGITVLQQDSLRSSFNSRGFNIGEVHIDGGAPLELGGNSAPIIVPDLAEYDQVQVLRGADGLFGGFGNPGGTVNLQRKTPQARPRADFDLSAGSWNNYRLEGDVTGPLAFDGRLRARMVGVYENKDYFYDTAHLERVKLYGILEYFLSSSTTLRAGGSYEKNNSVPVLYGVPHFDDGSDAHLPRSTALIPPWNRSNVEGAELFGQVEQRFGKDWVLKVNATSLHQTNDSKYAYVLGTINPVTNLIYGPSTSSSDSVSRNFMVDATLTGAFYLFGKRQEVIFGADHAHISSEIPLNIYDSYEPPFDPFTSNLHDLEEPRDVLLGANGKFRRNQFGVMSAVRLHPVEGLSLIGGARISWLRETLDSQTFFMGELLYEDTTPTRTTGKVVPYGGIVYELNSHYSIYASYSDIYNPSMPLLRADLSRLPSSIDGVNLETGIKGSWHNGTLNASLAFFKINQTGGSVSDPSVGSSPVPDCCFLSQTKHSKGIEAELSGKLAAGWWLTAGYTYNKNRTVSDAAPDGVVLSSQTPKHLFKLWTSYQLPGVLKAWTVGGGVVAQSASYVAGVGCPAFDPLGQCAEGVNPETPFHVTQKTYAVADLRVAYAFSRHWTAALSVNNLFDKKYYQNIGEDSAGYSSAWYGMPRNFLLKISAVY